MKPLLWHRSDLAPGKTLPHLLGFWLRFTCRSQEQDKKTRSVSPRDFLSHLDPTLPLSQALPLSQQQGLHRDHAPTVRCQPCARGHVVPWAAAGAAAEQSSTWYPPNHTEGTRVILHLPQAPALGLPLHLCKTQCFVSPWPVLPGDTVGQLSPSLPCLSPFKTPASSLQDEQGEIRSLRDIPSLTGWPGEPQILSRRNSDKFCRTSGWKSSGTSLSCCILGEFLLEAAQIHPSCCPHPAGGCGQDNSVPPSSLWQQINSAQNPITRAQCLKRLGSGLEQPNPSPLHSSFTFSSCFCFIFLFCVKAM